MSRSQRHGERGKACTGIPFESIQLFCARILRETCDKSREAAKCRFPKTDGPVYYLEALGELGTIPRGVNAVVE